MPAEWAPHLRTWMMWPCRDGVWEDLPAARSAYRDVAHAIAQFEPVTMVVPPNLEAQARDLLGGDIDILVAPIDDSWCRDAGPCFLVDARGGRAGVSFAFNAWGGKYHPFDADDAIAEVILNEAGVRDYASYLVAEGGGISVDGEGTLLTTRSCFPNANRNPDWTDAEIEDELKSMLGAEKVIWLPGNVLETETDGHVDGIATFVAPGKVLVEASGSPDHPFHAINKANIAALRGQSDAKGRPLEIIEIPDAESYVTDDDRMCLSYVNSYIVNGAVIAPKYGVREDAIARDILRDVFPDREIVQVDIRAIAPGGGGIHCITQQEPA